MTNEIICKKYKCNVTLDFCARRNRAANKDPAKSIDFGSCLKCKRGTEAAEKIQAGPTEGTHRFGHMKMKTAGTAKAKEFRPRLCTECRKLYEPTGARGTICPDCSPKKKKDPEQIIIEKAEQAIAELQKIQEPGYGPEGRPQELNCRCANFPQAVVLPEIKILPKIKISEGKRSTKIVAFYTTTTETIIVQKRVLLKRELHDADTGAVIREGKSKGPLVNWALKKGHEIRIQEEEREHGQGQIGTGAEAHRVFLGEAGGDQRSGDAAH